MSTHVRNFRCDDELWNAARAAAAAEGRTVTDVIVAALRRLVAPQFGDATATATSNKVVGFGWVDADRLTIPRNTGG
jgi:hypothetical protein